MLGSIAFTSVEIGAVVSSPELGAASVVATGVSWIADILIMFERLMLFLLMGMNVEQVGKKSVQK